MEDKIDVINKLVSSLYTKNHYSELSALSKLFSVSFLSKLEKILNKDCREEKFYREKYDVSYGWIDKIPLAQYTNSTTNIYDCLIDSRTELGDLLLVYTHTKTGTSKKTFDTRAVIVQAKISDRAFPLTPIKEMIKPICSTSKELKLLSEWPPFDLYKTSRSKTPVLENINLDTGIRNRKFAGYHKGNWYFGEPQYEKACDKTFGRFLIDFVSQKEGQEFTNKGESTGWDRLINKTISLCREYNLPPYLFGKQQPRFFDFGSFYSTPIILYLYFYFSPLLLPRKKFHVLIINKITEEGEKSSS